MQSGPGYVVARIVKKAEADATALLNSLIYRGRRYVLSDEASSQGSGPQQNHTGSGCGAADLFGSDGLAGAEILLREAPGDVVGEDGSELIVVCMRSMTWRGRG